MNEYLVYANSFAAPFFSDSSTRIVEAESPKDALEKFAAEYKHPARLYSAAVYESATAYHKGAKPLARWLSNHHLEQSRLTKGLDAYSTRGLGPGHFEIDGVEHRVEDPFGGMVVEGDE